VGAWGVLFEVTAAATNRVVDVIDAMTLNPERKRFYRLVTPRSP